GSGSPEGLLVAHLVFLLAMTASASALARADRALALAAGAFLVVAAVGGARGAYRYGSLLAVVDLAVGLGTLVAVGAAVRAAGAAAPLLLGVLVLAGLWQSVGIVGAWIANGFGVRGPGTLLNSDQAAAYMLLAFWAAIALLASRARATRGWLAG